MSSLSTHFLDDPIYLDDNSTCGNNQPSRGSETSLKLNLKWLGQNGEWFNLLSD